MCRDCVYFLYSRKIRNSCILPHAYIGRQTWLHGINLLLYTKVAVPILVAVL